MKEVCCGNLKLKWDSHIVQMLEYKDESRLNDIVDILNELYVSMEAFDTAGFSNCDWCLPLSPHSSWGNQLTVARIWGSQSAWRNAKLLEGVVHVPAG